MNQMNVIFIIAGIPLLLWLVYLLVLLRTARQPKVYPQALLTDYAHRGLHGGEIPENSLAAFRLAAEAGYGIELDLQLSRDGEVMVFHDYTLDRMTGNTGTLTALTAAELSRLHLLCADGTATAQRIPTLAQVLETVGGRVPLLIELKGESTDTALCPAADAILRDYPGDYCVESFNPMLLSWYKKHRPDVMRGQLYTDVFREKGRTPLNFLLSCMALNVLSRPHFIAYDRSYERKLPVRLTTGMMRAKRFVWTVRREEERPADGTPMIFEGIRP